MSKVFVLISDELYEFEKFYHAPRVFKSKEQARAAFDELYNKVLNENVEFEHDDWITDYNGDSMSFSSYPDGWWGTSHYDAYVAEVEVEE